MVHQLYPKRLRILWGSKYRKDQFYISVTHSLDELSNVTGYAKTKDIEVYSFLIFLITKIYLENSLLPQKQFRNPSPQTSQLLL